jgi:hypothetical protein
MTQANDSVTVTPGSGATVATHLANSKEYQAVVPCSESGHILGSQPSFIIQSGFQTSAQNKIYFDLFNATGSGKIVRVPMIYLFKNMAAQTGVAMEFTLARTTSVGTGGTALTPVKMDSVDPNLSASITARHAAAGGAASGSTLITKFYHSEETNVAAQVQEAFPFWPMPVPMGNFMQDIILNENEGLKLTQITNSTAGVWNCVVMFTVTP